MAHSIRKLWEGDVSLFKVFWGIGVIGTSVVIFLDYKFVRIRFSSVNLAFLLGWFVFASVIIWRSCRHYPGAKLWPVIAKLTIVLVWCGVIALGGTMYWLFSSVFGSDPSTTSSNIEAKIQYNARLPYIGFWKNNCPDKFGIAIEEAPDLSYFVRFCGPGGCFGKTKFTRTDLVTDARYKIIDDYTIGVKINNDLVRQLELLSGNDQEKARESIKDGFLGFKRCSELCRDSNSREVLVPAKDYQQALSDYSIFVSQARALPAQRDRNQLGVRIFSIARHSLWAQIGICNDDIIKTIDGQPLTDPTMLFTLFPRDHQAHVWTTVTVDRKGEQLTFRYQVDSDVMLDTESRERHKEQIQNKIKEQKGGLQQSPQNNSGDRTQ